MRFSEHRDRRSASRTLQVVADKRESLEYAQAEWLKRREADVFLPFAYDPAAKVPRFYYDVTGLARLKAYLGARLTKEQFLCMLRCVYDALDLCTAKRFSANAVCLDPDRVYVAEGGALRFAFVPLAGAPARAESSPRALLSHLARPASVSFADEADCRHQRALDDFVRRTSVLSLDALREFLKGEFGVTLGSDAVQEGVARAGAAMPRIRGGVRTGGSAAAFDMVGLLSRRASASEVMASQDLSTQAADAIAGVSPTCVERVRTRESAAAREEEEIADCGGAVASQAAAATEEDVPVAAKTQEQVDPPPAAPQAPSPAPVSSQRPAARHQTVILGRGDGSLASRYASVRPDGRIRVMRERGDVNLELDLTTPKVIGRSASADVVLADNTNVSRSHALVERDGGGFSIRDLGSLNGVFVRGERLARGSCAHVDVGERFLVADEALSIVEEGIGRDMAPGRQGRTGIR
ncbi:FHA domain-containing protein [Olsenella sp. HMSC062G07]|uniref:FHA domain-containing protein n=1 Tax=Olsenella sp. HMSC062G07 TaxID=1739330 RepID=UPI0008A1DD61|nr:FHA domain-containing protein [Olsenella sp. HMSC062G07]OFK22488.1 hypothetical protein HMPREF2826_01715 [Olsenella sp. HMSC062G07]